MIQASSRGGAKPRMIQGAQGWALDTGAGYEKKGIYEYSAAGGELARRVEPPHWMAQARSSMSGPEFKAALGSGAARPPAEEIGELRGHIFVRPSPEYGWPESALGVDEPIWERLLGLGPLARHVRFVACDPYGKLAFQLRIPAPDFVAKAKRVQTKASFMPQMMVGVHETSLFVAR